MRRKVADKYIAKQRRRREFEIAAREEPKVVYDHPRDIGQHDARQTGKVISAPCDFTGGNFQSKLDARKQYEALHDKCGQPPSGQHGGVSRRLPVRAGYYRRSDMYEYYEQAENGAGCRKADFSRNVQSIPRRKTVIPNRGLPLLNIPHPREIYNIYLISRFQKGKLYGIIMP